MLPVAYDFDFAGAVNTSYAVPDPQLRHPQRARREVPAATARIARRVPRRARRCSGEEGRDLRALPRRDRQADGSRHRCARRSSTSTTSTTMIAHAEGRAAGRLRTTASGRADACTATEHPVTVVPVRAPLRSEQLACARTRAAAARHRGQRAPSHDCTATSTSTRRTSAARSRRRLPACASARRRTARCRCASRGNGAPPMRVDARGARAPTSPTALAEDTAVRAAAARARRSGGARDARIDSRWSGSRAPRTRDLLRPPVASRSTTTSVTVRRDGDARTHFQLCVPPPPRRAPRASSDWPPRWSASTTCARRPATTARAGRAAAALDAASTPATAALRRATRTSASPIGARRRRAAPRCSTRSSACSPSSAACWRSPRIRRRRFASGCASSGS